MSKANYTSDVAIIGAGPSGLFAAFECGFMGYTATIIDALPQPGGQLAELYPEKPIYDIPGYPEILAGDLVNNLVKQAAPFNPQYVLGAPVLNLTKENDVFTLHTTEAKITAKVVIIAGGGGMFIPRKPNLENLVEFEPKSVHYAVKNKTDFMGKTLVIAGGGDSAVDWAVELSTLAKHIHVVHRRADFRAAEATVSQMKTLADQGKITLHTGQLTNLDGQNGTLQSVTIKSLEGQEKQLEADHLLCFFGLAPNAGPFGDWDLELIGKKIKTEPITQKTNIAGILAIGDMAQYEGKIGLILVGFSEATGAAKTAGDIINPDKKFKVQYSTSHKPGS